MCFIITLALVEYRRRTMLLTAEEEEDLFSVGADGWRILVAEDGTLSSVLLLCGMLL